MTPNNLSTKLRKITLSTVTATMLAGGILPSVSFANKKTKTYNSTTKSKLNSFKSKVDKINTLELQILGGLSLTFFLTCAGIVLAASGVGAVSVGLAAVGATTLAISKFQTLWTTQKDAKLYYGRL